MNYIYSLFRYEEDVNATKEKMAKLDELCGDNIIIVSELNEMHLARAFKDIEEKDARVESIVMNGITFDLLLKADDIQADYYSSDLAQCKIGRVWNADVYIYPSIEDNIIYLLADNYHLYKDQIPYIDDINTGMVAKLIIKPE